MAQLPGPLFAEIDRLTGALQALDDVQQLPAVARQAHDLRLAVPDAGLSGEMATRVISQINDRLTARVVALTAARHRLPPAAWCWLAMGSEGRDEQTLVSDQDNGLVFAASDAAESAALRQLFQPFGAEANQRLAECGFALCPGDIMAGKWCLSLNEWRERFIDWVRCPDPEALLNASIFFDLRPLTGDLSLGEALRDQLLALTSDTPAFLHLMAANALAAVPPLGLLGDIAVDADETLDLKKFGTRIFVDAARILALASGTRVVNSFDRLREAGPLNGLQGPEIAAQQAALSALLGLRLQHQRSPQGEAGFQPRQLHEFDRVILREALHQAKRLQQRLKLNYAL